MRLVDRRWAGIAKGVGVQKIIGRIHMVQIQIEQDFLTSSFSVLEQQPMDMLLGLDMLKGHQCTIDLKNSTLLIGTTGTITPFLSESDLPSCARLTICSDEEEVLTPFEGGTHTAAGPSNPTTIPTANVLPSDKFAEADVTHLVLLGFDRSAVVKQLRHFDGDKVKALDALVAKST